MLIGGEQVDAYEVVEIVSPATEELGATVARGRGEHADQAVEADQLNGEHGYIKTFLYELGQMETDDPSWLEKIRNFRQLVAEHARMEEQQVFPVFKRSMTEEQNAKITAMVNKDGFWQA